MEPDAVEIYDTGGFTVLAVAKTPPPPAGTSNARGVNGDSIERQGLIKSADDTT